MATPYNEAPVTDPQDATAASHLKQCLICGGITGVETYEEGGVCEFCGARLLWHPIELQ
jgi:hypothetical protein